MAVNLTDEEKELIIHLRSKGHSLLDIASSLGRSVTSVKRVLREAGVNKGGSSS